MRGHQQTSGLVRVRLGIWLCLAILATTSQASAQSQDSLAPDSRPATTERDTAPVKLSANRVRHWEENGEKFVLLEDQASVFQGETGLRATTILVRIQSRSTTTGTGHHLDVYAEGKVVATQSPGLSLRASRWELDAAELRLSASEKGRVAELSRSPAGLPILARAFPKTSLTTGLTAATSLPQEESPPVAASRSNPVEEPRPIPTPSRDDAMVRVSASEPGPDANLALTQFVDRDAPGFPDSPVGTPPRAAQNAPEIGNVAPTPFTPSRAPSTPLADDFGPSEAPPVLDNTPPAPRSNNRREVPDLDPLPGAPPRTEPIAEVKPPPAPIQPGSQRVTRILPRSGTPFTFETLPTQPNGTSIVMITGGVNLVTTAPRLGTVDAEADRVIIWLRNGQKPLDRIGINGEIVQSDRDPMEVYLDGHVVFRQDERRFQGRSDQKTFQARAAYYDYQKDQFLGVDTEIDLFAPGLISPLKIKSPMVLQHHPIVEGPNGPAPSELSEIRAEQTVSTGSRFARPGYRFKSRSIDVRRVVSAAADPVTGKTNGGPGKFEEDDLTWLIDARQNLFFMGRVPVFYWPRFVTEADDLDIPLRQLIFRTNNYFGQQVLTDWNMFKLLNLRRPPIIDTWNLDIDYLSARAKKPGQGIALGSEIGWFGNDLLRDIRDPYHRRKDFEPSVFRSYAGYFDIWGLSDGSKDVLGPGPAVITQPGFGKKGFSREFSPPFQEFRGRFVARHMQSLLPDDADPLEDFRLNLEAAYVSDRQFLEQYYKRLYDTGLDQETLGYLIRQKENWAITLQAEANLQDFYTDTQWLPKLDYYRLGDSFLGNLFTHFQHTGVDYANVHTANEVNNPNIFAFIPYDPVSNTSGSFSSGRIFTTHEIDMPINLNLIRVVPYVQGQAIGWNNQINGDSVGRLWGGAGARADIMAHRAFPTVESELLNLHGLNHKIDFVADYRTTYSNVHLPSIGIQDDLDDNTYEFVRRYFALTTYTGGILPMQYDPRYLLLRRGISPITGTTDVQDTIQTLRLGIHQRLQTQRGPEGRRRIIDYMVFDLDTTYFPNAARDNFNKSIGQTTYNWEWYVGDRTSIVSYGWFEQFDITGLPINAPAKNPKNPFGINVITTGVSISRPPRGNIFLGYSIIDTGTISTSAINASYSYWMSPKYYTTFGTSYDFGNRILLGANFSLTRIGADYLTTVGLAVDPQRQSYQFSFEIAPRLSPSLRFGSGAGLNRLDTRFAPVE